jgi:hypothetical protein
MGLIDSWLLLIATNIKPITVAIHDVNQYFENNGSVVSRVSSRKKSA